MAHLSVCEWANAATYSSTKRVASLPDFVREDAAWTTSGQEIQTSPTMKTASLRVCNDMVPVPNR